MPCLATVYGVLNLSFLRHGNIQTDNRRVESTRFKTAHIDTASLERAGLRVDYGTQGIINHHTRFAFIPTHRGRNAYPIVFCPILHHELGARAVLSLNDIAEPVILLPSIRYRYGSRTAVHVGRCRKGAFGSGTKGSQGIDAYFESLGRFYRKLEGSGCRMRFIRTEFLNVFGRVNRRESEVVRARLQGANREFLTGKGNYRGIDNRNTPPHIVDVGILQAARNKTLESNRGVEANRLGPVDRYIELAGIFDAYGHAALGRAVVAVGNRYGINRGEQLVLGGRRIGIRGKQGGVGQTVPTIGIRRCATAYQYAHRSRIADMDGRVGIHDKLRLRINRDMQGIGSFGIVHTSVLVIADNGGDRNLGIALHAVQTQCTAVAGRHLTVHIPLVVVTRINGTRSGKDNRRARTDSRIAIDLGNGNCVIHHINERATAINCVASQQRVGGDSTATEQGIRLVVSGQSLGQYQCYTIGTHPNIEIAIRQRVERTPGSTVIVRNLPEVDIGVRPEALYLQIDERCIAGASLGARTTQDKLRAGKHFHMNAGLVTVATDRVAGLYRVDMVDSRLNHRGAVVGAVRFTDIERGIPFVFKVRFPILDHFRPQLGFAVVGNDGVFVSRQNRSRQHIHVNHPRLLAVGIETLYFGAGGNDGINTVAILQAVGSISLIGAYESAVQIPFHRGILTGIGQTGNHLRGIEQHIGEQADGLTREYIHIDTQNLGRFHRQSKVRRTNRVLDVVECTMLGNRIHIGLRPDIFVDTRVGDYDAVGTGRAGDSKVATVPIVADRRIGHFAAAVNQVGAYGKVATLALGAVGGKQEEYRRITLRTLYRQGIANRLKPVTLSLAAHLVNQGIVHSRKAGFMNLQYAVGRNHLAVYIPLVVYLGGDSAGTAGKFDVLQFNIAYRIHRRSGTVHRDFRVKVQARATFLDTANQNFVLIVVDITALANDKQYIAFLIRATCPDMVAAFVNPQVVFSRTTHQIECIVGIVAAPVIPPAVATVVGTAFVVDTHHGITFLTADYITVHKVAVQYGGRSDIIPTSTLATVFDNLTAGHRNQGGRSEIPGGVCHFRIVAGIERLFHMRPKRVGSYDAYIGRVAGNATVTTVGFHHKVGRQGRHRNNHRIGIETKSSMVDVNGFVNRIGGSPDITDNRLFITVEHRPRIVNVGVLPGLCLQGQIMSDTERIGRGSQSGVIDNSQRIEVAHYLFNHQTRVEAGKFELEPVFVRHRSCIGNRITLAFTRMAYRIGSHLRTVAVKNRRSERIPPLTGKDEPRRFALANRLADQFGIERKFLLDIAYIYRIVGMAVLRCLDIYVVGKEACIGAVENLVRTVRIAVAVADSGGRCPGIGVDFLVVLVVCRIKDGQVVADADLKRVGHLDMRQRMNGKVQGVERVATTVLVDHLGYQHAAFLSIETDGVVVGRSQSHGVGRRDKRPFGTIETVGNAIGNSTVPYAEIEAVGVADFPVGTQIRIRQFKHNHHNTLKVGATFIVCTRYAISGCLGRPYHNAAVVNGGSIHIHR